MMEWGELKPILSAAVLPPVGPLLVIAVGLLIGWTRRRTGLLLALAGLLALWFLSCNAVAVALSRSILPPVTPVQLGQLKAQSVQAVVVLGGGVNPHAPEYGRAQPAHQTASRLTYGIWLAKQAQLPIAFAGGVGWAATGTGTTSEGEVARHVALDKFGVTLRWVDDQSRDTVENARLLAKLMQRDGVRRIALVTDAWHMPRSVRAFERAGFTVVPAPTGFSGPLSRPLLEWMPSVGGLALTHAVLREWLALQVAKVQG